MSPPIEPIGPALPPSSLDMVDAVGQERRRGDRRKNDRKGKALVATGKTVETEDKRSAKPASVAPPPPAAFAAQVLGQPGKKRGLRGGAEVLDNARNTYLSREFSGGKERRPLPGQSQKTEI